MNKTSGVFKDALKGLIEAKALFIIPKIDDFGHLIWVVKVPGMFAVIDSETGEIGGTYKKGVSHAFDAVVGALSEWYLVDKHDYSGENILKVKSELYSV